jgi:hypothetical protein
LSQHLKIQTALPPHDPTWSSENRSSRRNFLRNAGAVSLGLAGVATGAISAQAEATAQNTATKKPGNLFSGQPQSLQDRISSVLTATIGMQRYNWEGRQQPRNVY